MTELYPSSKDELDELINTRFVGRVVTGFCFCRDHIFSDGERGFQVEIRVDGGVIMQIDILKQGAGITLLQTKEVVQ